jgi:hypothetical protein
MKVCHASAYTCGLCGCQSSHSVSLVNNTRGHPAVFAYGHPAVYVFLTISSEFFTQALINAYLRRGENGYKAKSPPCSRPSYGGREGTDTTITSIMPQAPGIVMEKALRVDFMPQDLQNLRRRHLRNRYLTLRPEQFEAGSELREVCRYSRVQGLDPHPFGNRVEIIYTGRSTRPPRAPCRECRGRHGSPRHHVPGCSNEVAFLNEFLRALYPYKYNLLTQRSTSLFPPEPVSRTLGLRKLSPYHRCIRIAVHVELAKPRKPVSTRPQAACE